MDSIILLKVYDLSKHVFGSRIEKPQIVQVNVSDLLRGVFNLDIPLQEMAN